MGCVRHLKNFLAAVTSSECIHVVSVDKGLIFSYSWQEKINKIKQQFSTFLIFVCFARSGQKHYNANVALIYQKNFQLNNSICGYVQEYVYVCMNACKGKLWYKQYAGVCVCCTLYNAYTFCSGCYLVLAHILVDVKFELIVLSLFGCWMSLCFELYSAQLMWFRMAGVKLVEKSFFTSSHTICK